MKNLTTLLILIGCMPFITISYAAENKSSTLTAEKICSPKIEIFSTDNMESLLGLANSEKLASYQVVLCTPGEQEFKAIFKYNSNLSGGFKRIMSYVKEHAVPGSVLFVDEIKTASGEQIQDAAFYLK